MNRRYVFAWYLCVLWIVSCVLWGVCNFTDLLQLTPLYDRCASGYYLAGEGDGQTQVTSFPPLKGRPARAWERDTTQFSFIHFSCRLRCRIDYEPYVSTLPILCSLADVYVAFHLLQQLQHQYQQLLQQV